jgi:microcystin-dependent protein
MVDPVTTNRGYAIPTRNSDVGTWDVPLNGDFSLIDQNLGAVSTLSVSNANVVLNSTQYACGTIRLTGLLTADITLTFPQVSGWWLVDHQATGSFDVQLICNAGANRIGLPKGVASDIFTDGSNIAFRNLPSVGCYWDYAASAVPRWVSFCSVAPWLLCDGSTYNAGTYPNLFNLLGTTTLPDFRGRASYSVNAGTGRLTTAGAGIDGNTLFASGGNNGVTLAANQIPAGVPSSNASQAINVTSAFSDILRLSPSTFGGSFNQTGGFGFGFLGSAPGLINVASSGNNNISVTSTNGGQAVVPSTTPGVISGIRMIRAA